MAYTRNPSAIRAGRGLTQNPPPIPKDPSGALLIALDGDIASKTQLGIVQIGDGIDVTPEGVISVSSSPVDNCKTVTIEGDYYAQLDDYYIGAQLSDAATIFLPVDPPDCVEYFIKLQYGAPIGTRKLTISGNGGTIDDAPDVVLTTPYQSISLISNNQKWWIL